MAGRRGSNDRSRGRVDQSNTGRDETRQDARGARLLKKKVKSARGRTISSKLWLERQLNDPYVAAAKKEGYRSRAAFKLIELDDRFGFLFPGARVVDLGAAPGGWSQITAKRIANIKSSKAHSSRIVAVDIQEIEPIAGVKALTLDFLDPTAPDEVQKYLGGKVDVVLSDMAAPATGHKQTDHMRIITLCEAALDFACQILRPGGHFVAKVLQGGTERDLLLTMKHSFSSVRHAKPKASRADSAEIYVVAQDFKGGGA